MRQALYPNSFDSIVGNASLPPHLEEILYLNRDPLPVRERFDGERNSDQTKRLVALGEPVIMEAVGFSESTEAHVVVTYPSGFSEGWPDYEKRGGDRRHFPLSRIANVMALLGVTDHDFVDFVESTLCSFGICAVFPIERLVRNVSRSGARPTFNEFGLSTWSPAPISVPVG